MSQLSLDPNICSVQFICRDPVIPDPSGQLAEFYATSTRVDLYSYQILLLCVVYLLHIGHDGHRPAAAFMCSSNNVSSIWRYNSVISGRAAD